MHKMIRTLRWMITSVSRHCIHILLYMRRLFWKNRGLVYFRVFSFCLSLSPSFCFSFFLFLSLSFLHGFPFFLSNFPCLFLFLFLYPLMSHLLITYSFVCESFINVFIWIESRGGTQIWFRRGVPLKPSNLYPSLRVILAEKGTHY